MAKYLVTETETKDVLCECTFLSEAIKCTKDLIALDKANGVYKRHFYTIIDANGVYEKRF